MLFGTYLANKLYRINRLYRTAQRRLRGYSVIAELFI